MPRISQRGLSMVEIMVVAALSSVILFAGTYIMSRTTRTFQKGTHMMNTQVLMESIVERLRTDIRALRALDADKCTDSKLVFDAVRFSPEKNAFVPTRITYEYDQAAKTLTRSEGSDRVTDFHGKEQVDSCIFQPLPDKDTFNFLNLILQLRSEKKGEGTGSRLSIVCQFHPKSQTVRNPLANPR